MSRHNQRMAFERWISAPPYERSTRRFNDEGNWPKQYRDLAVQLAWEAWQEASKAGAATRFSRPTGA